MFVNIYKHYLVDFKIEKFDSLDEAKITATKKINLYLAEDCVKKLFQYGNIVSDSNGIIKIDITHDESEDVSSHYLETIKYLSIELKENKRYVIRSIEPSIEVFELYEFDNENLAKEFIDNEIYNLKSSLSVSNDGLYTINKNGDISCEIEPTKDVFSKTGNIETSIKIQIDKFIENEMYTETYFYKLI